MTVKIAAKPAASNPNPGAEYTDDEDTSNSEDTEDQDTDEEEEQNEEGDEEGEESETDEEESTDDSADDEEVEQHIDLKNVPPQLRDAAKAMLKSHTKAMQKVAKSVQDRVAAAEAKLQDEYSEVIVRATGFNKIVSLPEWKKFEEDVIRNRRPYGYSSEFRQNGKRSEEDDSSAPSGGKAITAESIMKELGPAIVNLIDERMAPDRKRQSDALWEDAEKNLPNFRKYKAAVTRTLTEHPSLTIKQAYTLVTGGKEDVQKEVKEGKEIAKKLPKTLKGGSGGGSKPLSEKTIESIDAALALAMREPSRRGG